MIFSVIIHVFEHVVVWVTIDRSRYTSIHPWWQTTNMLYVIK